jgi:hypothetical protein
MNGYLRRSFYVPLVARLRQAGLVLDTDTANAEVRRWLREVADTRVHGTTGLKPGEQLQRERAVLLPLTAPYAPLAKPTTLSDRQMLRERFGHWPQALQHPLSVYDRLLGVTA